MELELSAAAWIFLAAAVFFAAIVRGFVGFGFSALTVASLVFVLPPAVVVPLVLMLEVAASIQMLPGAWRHADFQWLLPTAAGVAVGSALFSSEKNYRPLASALILTAAAVGLLKIALG